MGEKRSENNLKVRLYAIGLMQTLMLHCELQHMHYPVQSGMKNRITNILIQSSENKRVETNSITNNSRITNLDKAWEVVAGGDILVTVILLASFHFGQVEVERCDPGKWLERQTWLWCWGRRRRNVADCILCPEDALPDSLSERERPNEMEFQR